MGSVLLQIIKMKVVLAVLLLVAASSAAPWGVLPYSGLTAGVIPAYTGLNHLTYSTNVVAPVSTKFVNVDGGWPYTDAEGMSTGLANAGARVPISYAAASPITYAGAFPYHLPIST